MLVSVLTLGLALEVVLGVAFLGGDRGGAQLALPLHPVASTFAPDDTRVEQCSSAACFEQAVGNIAYERGPHAAFAVAMGLYDGGSDPACHRAAHAIGAASLVRFRGDVARTLAEGSSSCWSGYYHGVLERSLVPVKSKEPRALARVARPLCSGVADSTTPWIAYQCLHGLGHGLMLTTGLDLPRSLAVCRALSSVWDRSACKGGVFMENISPSYGVRSRWLRDDDPVYPCNAVRRGDRFRCYQMVTSRILPLVDDSWERTAALCGTVERGFRPVCFHSFGRDASSRSGRDPNQVLELCAGVRPLGGEDDCLAAAATDMTANFASGEAAARLCAMASADVQDACYGGLGAVLGAFERTASARARRCRTVAPLPTLARACLAGAARALPREKKA